MARLGALLLLEEAADGVSTVFFDPEIPPVLQRASWTCSAATLAWMLRSVGMQDVSEELIVSLLQSNHAISPEDGLLDHTGLALVRLIGALGWQANPLAADHGGEPLAVTFDEVAAVAGELPVGMGGAAFNHWVGVRGFDGSKLLLANPAPGYKGIGQTMDRGQFRALGPFYAVAIAT